MLKVKKPNTHIKARYELLSGQDSLSVMDNNQKIVMILLLLLIETGNIRVLGMISKTPINMHRKSMIKFR